MATTSRPAVPERESRQAGVRRSHWRCIGGFTLIELLMAVAIAAILATIAVPSYQETVRKSRRADAKVALEDLANRLERYYADNNTYVGPTIATGTSTDILSSANSPEGYYTLSIEAQSASGFTIKATRKSTGPQANDTRCGDFTLDQAGTRGISGGTGTAADCW